MNMALASRWLDRRCLMGLVGLALLGITPTDAETFTGDGTAYSLGDNLKGGNCALQEIPAFVTDNYVAMNHIQFQDTGACGTCVQLACVDQRCTNHQSEVAYVLDHCSECKPGDLDMSETMFRRITGNNPHRLTIQWQFVECPMLQGNVQVCLKEQNEHHLMVQPKNFAKPVKTVTLNDQMATKTPTDFRFVLHSDAAIDLTKVKVALTSQDGETIEDTMNLSVQCTESKVQFKRTSGEGKGLDGAWSLVGASPEQIAHATSSGSPSTISTTAPSPPSTTNATSPGSSPSSSSPPPEVTSPPAPPEHRTPAPPQPTTALPVSGSPPPETTLPHEEGDASGSVVEELDCGSAGNDTKQSN